MIKNTFCTILLSLFFVTLALPGQKGDDKMRAFTVSIQDETSKNYAKAIQGMMDIKEAYKNDYLVHLRLGWLYYLAKEYETSVKYYQEAVRLSDNSIESMLGITMPYAELKKWDNVQEMYKNIIAKDKYHYTANLRLGQMYYNVGNYVIAKKYFETVYENYPGDYEINLYMGWTFYYLGSRTKAQYYFVNAIVLNASDTSAKDGLELTK
ncbi:MAG: tetratricopeptide repeat protein [Bacteroidota bacterium]